MLSHSASNVKVHSLIEYSLTDFDAGLKATLDWYTLRSKEGTQ
ncbi:hypothetical protein PSQ19_17215 [Devosia algicola]|uniref:Uncharacterized protein n=1 Tax=Devosia algicola TaxID=3026418 RepID=A0ABY7YM48_9HYPH|nr:hypothetical protein [Devosia algicola]WDR02341.1 hypothetical protein PSQ19_17215 [Devosia algicola]